MNKYGQNAFMTKINDYFGNSKKTCIEEYLLRYFNTVLNKYGDKMLFAALNVSNDVALIDASALLCIDFNELAT